MNIDLIFQIAGIGLLISVLNIVLKQAGKEEQAHLLGLVGVVIVLLLIIPTINQLFQTIRSVFRL
ncbi:MAG TPA: stage III sporulation protein AC [bacterium]|nr:stage III sporulation protein AC [bacterium]